MPAEWTLKALNSLGLVGLVLISFLAFRWYLTPRPLAPSAALPTAHDVAVNDPRPAPAKLAGAPEAARDRLRQATLDAAETLGSDPCNPVLKASYVKAATAYVRAWLSLAQCTGTSSCAPTDSGRLDQAAQAFGSPLDLRVRNAMAQVHKTGVLAIADFPPDVVRPLATMARDPMLDPRASPQYLEASEQLGQTHPSVACSNTPPQPRAR
jgi:hypothetical protein